MQQCVLSREGTAAIQDLPSHNAYLPAGQKLASDTWAITKATPWTSANSVTPASSSLLGFGCGAVGGLMVRGAVADQERAVARALDAGVNYFDTAVQYGDGRSEENLGRILATLKPADAIVGTKVRLRSRDFGRIAAAVRESLEGSLRRLKRAQVDILHLHNEVTKDSVGESLSVRQVLDDVAPAFETLRKEGKLRFIGSDGGRRHRLAASGDRFAQIRIRADRLQHAQPLRRAQTAARYPAQDYGQLFGAPMSTGTGVVGDSRAGRRRALRRGGAPQDRQPRAGTDRLGQQLRRRSRARTAS